MKRKKNFYARTVYIKNNFKFQNQLSGNLNVRIFSRFQHIYYTRLTVCEPKNCVFNFFYFCADNKWAQEIIYSAGEQLNKIKKGNVCDYELHYSNQQ